jgi:SNF2 family DNA or RNA helicase
MKTAPYQHQIDAVTKARGRPAFGYFCEMGTGKSKMLIDEFCELWLAGSIDTVVITAGKGSYANWSASELPTHMWDEVYWDEYMWTGRDSQSERARQREFCRRPSEPTLRILLVNIEALGVSSRAREFVRKFVASGRCLFAVDESTLIKNHTANRSVFCTAMGAASAYRRIMTGTPVTRDPIDLWGQFAFLGGDLLGFRSFFAWRARYAVMQEMRVGSRTVTVPVAFRNLEELTEIVAPHVYRALKEDCLDLPPKVYVYRDVQLTEEQLTHYHSMRRHGLATLGEPGGESVATAKNVMGIMTRLHQILMGRVTDDDRVLHRLPSWRIPALLDLVEESNGAPTIVWCAFVQDVLDVSRALGDVYGAERVVVYYGQTSTEERTEAIRRFQGGEADFIVLTLATGCRGITLTRATLMVYYSNTFDAEHRWQSEDRAHRIGQRSTLLVADIRARGTIDEKIIRALREKFDVAALINGDEGRKWLED